MSMTITHLEDLRTQAQPLDGVYVVPRYQGEIVAATLPPEDFKKGGGKREGDPRFHNDLIPLAPAMLSIVSGAMEDRYYGDFTQAAVTEMSQEASVKIDPRRLKSLNLPPTETLQQRPNQDLLLLLGHGFLYDLDDDEMSRIYSRMRIQTRRMLTGSAEFLTRSHLSLRPFFEGLLLRNLESEAL